MSDKTRHIEIVDDGSPQDEQIFNSVIDPATNAAFNIMNFKNIGSDGLIGSMDINPLLKTLSDQNKALSEGDLSRPEAMLLSQAHSLDALFTALVSYSGSNLGENIDAMEKYMRLALKAQSQCQATIRTLGELKSPKQLAFIKQANVAHGPQQVNNGDTRNQKSNGEHQSPTREKESKNQSNELLTEDSNNGLDFRAQGAAVSNDPEVEAVGEINRTAIK